MRILTKILEMDAVYWPPNGQDEFGTPAFGSPIDLKVRWEDVTETFMNAKGEAKTSKSKVYVGQDVQEEGALWLGTVATLTNPTKPFAQPNAWQISAFSKIPTLNAKQFLRIAWL